MGHQRHTQWLTHEVQGHDACASDRKQHVRWFVGIEAPHETQQGELLPSREKQRALFACLHKRINAPAFAMSWVLAVVAPLSSRAAAAYTAEGSSWSRT